MSEQKIYTIELDCPPGATRPGHLIEDVIAGTGLPSRDPVSRLFGEWTWNYTDVPDIADLWPKIQPTLKERITKLYGRGVIRFGSW